MLVTIAQCIMVASVIIVFYNYIGYGLLIYLVVKIKKMFQAPVKPKDISELNGTLPSVTLAIAAYNEANIIEMKISNCMELDYPKEKLNILFIIDGSSDNSEKILKNYTTLVGFVNDPERRGKSEALNHGMRHVNTPITIFCDANTSLNSAAIKNIIRHYDNPKIGGVAGEKKIINPLKNSAHGQGEGLYWKYESTLKRLDAEFYTVAGAAGELLSIRTALWEPLPKNVLLDDFIISSRINIKGFRIAYEPNATASEYPSESIEDEMKRKIRISAGGFQSMMMISDIFNIFKHPILFFQFVSHRFLRWTLSPLCFPLLLLSNIYLALVSESIFYKLAFALQCIFYTAGIMGSLSENLRQKIKVFNLCYYILFMNISVFFGFAQFIRKKQTVIWHKAIRQNMVEG